MTTSRPIKGQQGPHASSSGRSAAVGDLFAALEGLLITYQALSDDEREQRWNDEAELITGAVAMHLSTARGRLSSRPRRPMTRPAESAPAPEMTENR